MSTTPADSESPNRLSEHAVPAAHGEAGVNHNRARLWLALAGLAAGLVAFGLGELVYDLIPAAKEKMKIMGHEVIAPTLGTANVAMTRNSAITFGLLGACLGSFLGAAGGLAWWSVPGMVTAGLVGSIVGLGLAAGASLLVLPRLLAMQPDYPDSDLLFSVGIACSDLGPGSAAWQARPLPSALGERKLLLGASGWRFPGSCTGGRGLRPDRGRGFPFCQHGPADLDDLANPAHGQAHDHHRCRRPRHGFLARLQDREGHRPALIPPPPLLPDRKLTPRARHGLGIG